MTKKIDQHNDVLALVKSLSETRDFSKDFEKHLAERQLIKSLMVLRTRADLSQKDVADKLSCTQSKVSKLESGTDVENRLGDLIDYTGAVGYEMRVILAPKGQTIVDEVKMHAFIIQRLLGKLVTLAGNDGKLTEGVATFLKEAALNLVGIVESSANALPRMRAEPAHPFHVESAEIEESLLTPDK